MRRLRARREVQFFAALWRAARSYATAWWFLLALRGLLPAALAVATGALIGAVQHGDSLAEPLTIVGVVFVLFQVLTPLHLAVGANLGSRTGSYLNDRLMTATTSPPGVAHLEDPDLITDLTVARDFDLGITGPPLSISMDLIASGLVELVGGLAAAALLFGYAWWAAPLVAGAWLSTHWLLRESAIWRDRNTDEVRSAQRHSEYAYRLAVDAPAAKEVRLFGLADWVIERFTTRRRYLYDLQRESTRLRERSLASSLVIVLAANVFVAWSIADAAADGRITLDRAVVFLTAMASTSMIAFGGWSWALDGACAPVVALNRLEPKMAAAGALSLGTRPATGLPLNEIRFTDVTFAYRPDLPPVLEGFDLTIPAGSSLAIVGVNGAGKTTLAKLLCRLYDPQRGAIEIAGIDLRTLDLVEWRCRLTAVFQDFVRYELSLRANVAPRGGVDADITAALHDAGAHDLAALDTILAKSYASGIDLSGGQWQRVALARALAAVHGGARVVLLDEPTAQLDVRGEAEIFERILAATRDCTTILVSHRFSTVRHADRICVVDHGRVVELGSHDELMAQRGRYHTMFELQASRFADAEFDERGEEVAGAVIALVGENGAGKSTLVKLLADMYTPSRGRITIDGVDLARMDPNEWRARLAGAFQDFFRFEFLAHTTVGIGDHPRLDERPAVERAITHAGADDVVERLASGLDTQLGPTWEGGVDVSFGQWQKLALSRGFMREEPLLLVLDEPTAALDAETEHALFERFAAAARGDDASNGRVTILVSHRFSTLRRSDLIVVIDGARVVEVGTHDELMARHGHYADLYSIQAAAYR